MASDAVVSVGLSSSRPPDAPTAESLAAAERMPVAPLVRLGARDDAAIATMALRAGQSYALGDELVTVSQDIPRGHKVALRELRAGDLVRKYGHVIGIATADVAAGEHLHTHNLGMPDDPRSLATAERTETPERSETLGRTETSERIEKAERHLVRIPEGLRRTFLGYERADGRVGTRNYVAVITTVNCSATVAKHIARACEPELRVASAANGSGGQGGGCDGVFAITHAGGCGMANTGEGWEILRRTLTGYARNPNVGGVVLVGLGCEVNTLDSLVEQVGVAPGIPVEHFTIQDVGGTVAAIEEGRRRVVAMAQRLAQQRRVEVGVDKLVLGMQCGGSDAFSALTANPALGVASDLIVAQGGTTILGETPEIYGAELMLAARATDKGVADTLLARIRWWEEYTASFGTTLDGNPSPGNKAGGISTILEKSLGAVAKGGQAPLAQVVAYAEPTTGPGLVFMDTPGYDPVSTTGMVAGGATLVAFTTGRGSCFGSKPAPTVKLATNSAMARHLQDDMDLDCGPVIEQGVPLPEMGRAVYELLLDIASGAPSRSESLGLGDEEFIPWQIGAVL